MMPWGLEPGKSYWTRGEFVSVDGAPTGPVREEDVEEILFHGDTGARDWDGKEAAVLKLRSGTYVAYETWWGPTGDGFHEDAYGGDEKLYFGRDLNNLILTALSDEGRRLCGIPAEGLA